MIGSALAVGVRSATRRPALVALLWAWNLALALIVALPFMGWIASATALSPEADRLLNGFNVALVTQLIKSDPAIVPALMSGVGALLLLSLISGAFLSGGLLEVVLAAGDERPFLHRFFRGAGHFFGRFLRLLVLADATAIVVTGLVAAGLSAARRPFVSGGSEPAALWTNVVVAAAVFLLVAFFMLAHDYARAATVITGARGMLRTWLRAMAFVLGHLAPVALIAAVAAVVVAVALVAPFLYGAHGARTWAVIGGAILLQQVMALTRVAARVGQVSAQASYCRQAMPASWLTVPPVGTTPPVGVEPVATEPPALVASPGGVDSVAARPTALTSTAAVEGDTDPLTMEADAARPIEAGSVQSAPRKTVSAGDAPLERE